LPRCAAQALAVVLGVVSATVVLVGKFTFESDPTMYAGLAALIGASVWNTSPTRRISLCCRTSWHR
jgi:hypothetical protein